MLNFISIILNIVFAATHPLTGSSIVNYPINSFALAQMGFSITSVPKDWTYNKTVDDNAKSIELGSDKKTLLSFRLENISAKTQLEPYVRQYLRDYNQYGLEVIGLQSHNKSSTPSVIVDLKQKNSINRSRQVFFYKTGKVLIATCSDDSTNFEKTFSICNQILGTFKWRNN